MLHAARRDPTTLAIGVDADAASLRDASWKAARAAKKGGLPNAVFVVAAVEALPEELEAIADEVRITFPWGSLLRGVFGADGDVLDGIARVARPGAEVRSLFSVIARDRLDVPDAIDRSEYDAHGLRVFEERAASTEDIAATDSSWAKLLRAGVTRSATMVRSIREER